MTASTTILLPLETHTKLQRLARDEGKAIDQVIDRLIEDDEQRRFFDQMAKDFERIRSDPEAWSDYQHELALLDTTLLDGLEADSAAMQDHHGIDAKKGDR